MKREEGVSEKRGAVEDQEEKRGVEK